MSFLFGKNKKAPVASTTGLPAASRNLTSREGTPNGGPSYDPLSSASLKDATLVYPPNGSAPRLAGDSRSTSSPPPEAKNAMIRPGNDMQKGMRTAPQRPPPDASLYPWSHRRLAFNQGQNPFPRYGASVNGGSSKDGEIYMMGGLIDGATVKGDLWILEGGAQPTRCYEVETTSEGPGPRVGHSSLLVGNAFIVFGGDTKVDEHDILDDTLYLLNTSTKEWSRAAPAGPRPAGRYGHTLNIIGSKIYVMGGQVEGYFFNDLLAFDLNALQGINSKWEVLVANTNDGGPPQGQSPPARTNHTVVTYDDKLVLFGGTDGTHWFNDVWTYDPRINAWTQQDCIGYIPAAREGHAAAVVGDVMYVFGGRTEEGKDLGDVAGFRISTRRWYTFQNMGPSPSPRSGHGMTTFGNRIFVFGGEPSSTPRNPIELSDAYVLDTSKIRYPEEKTGTKPATFRRPSITDRSTTPQQERAVSRDGQSTNQSIQTLNTKASQDSMASNRPQLNTYSATGQGFRPGQVIRSGSAASGPPPSGPPPVQAAPQPQTNGTRHQMQPRSEEPESPRMLAKVDRILGRQPSKDNMNGATSHDQQNGVRGLAATPGSYPTQGSQDGPYAGAATQYMHQKQSSQDSMSRKDSAYRRTETPDAAVRAGEDLIQSGYKQPYYADSGFGSSPALSTQQASPDSLVKELDAARSKIAWYASELALARRAGYRSSAAESVTSLSDDRTVDAFGDEEKPLLEALVRMRAELTRVQDSFMAQSTAAAESVAQAERDKEAAVQEVLSLRTQQASRDGGFVNAADALASSDAGNRKLAAALLAHGQLKLQIQHLTSTLESERAARNIAEQSASAAHSRALELDTHKQQDGSALESLRAELHEAQRLARDHATTSTNALSSSRMLQIDNDGLSTRLMAAQRDQKTHVTTLTTLRDAVAASSDKSATLERQLDEERDQRTQVAEKLSRLRADHEATVLELDSATRDLQAAEDLISHHAAEAETHRAALLTGLDQHTSRDLDEDAVNDERVASLQQSLSDTQALAQQHKDAADEASDRLRSAEERIAGLEAFQEQSSREGLGLRKQLQVTSRDVIAHQTAQSELQQLLNQSKLDMAAWQMQHSTLKNILTDRGLSAAQMETGDSLADVSQTQRLRQLEEQADTSARAQEEMRRDYESRETELRQARDAEYGSLENECQQMREYIDGFHDVAEKLKKNIKKEKAENQSLRDEITRTRQSSNSETAAAFEAERSSMREEIEELQSRVTRSQAELEKQMQELKEAMGTSDAYKDESLKYQRELESSTSQNRADIDSLRAHNGELQIRAEAAENKVKMLLETVGTSVNNYRRQSQSMPGINGVSHSHSRQISTNSLGGGSPSHNNGMEESGPDRGSAVFDSFVTELDNLRSQWEMTSKTYNNNRFSDQSQTNSNVAAGSPTTITTMADWRRRLDVDEDDADKA